jgi:hypothetical protein
MVTMEKAKGDEVKIHLQGGSSKQYYQLERRNVKKE